MKSPKSNGERCLNHMMNELNKNDFTSPLIGVAEVQKLLGISRSKAYQIIKVLNDELNQYGFITINGRVSRKYFAERIRI